MEIAGLAVGAVGLAGLFDACLGTIECIHSYKAAGHESNQIITVFDANKLLLQRWGDGVGISENKLGDVHHPYLDDAAVASTVEKILSSICDIFKMTDSTSSKLRMKSIDSEMFSLKKSDIQLNNTQLVQSKKARVLWASGGKARLASQAEDFGLLVEKLYMIVPIEKAGSFLTGTSSFDY